MKFVAFERAKQGTGASRRLRITGRTPGIVYGGKGEPQLIELDHNALWHALKKEAFHASILDMEVGGQSAQVLLRDVQYHPYKQQVLHIDFQRVDANTKMHKKVPLHYSGEENSPAVKTRPVFDQPRGDRIGSVMLAKRFARVHRCGLEQTDQRPLFARQRRHPARRRDRCDTRQIQPRVGGCGCHEGRRSQAC